jgi:hypothetical protein
MHLAQSLDSHQKFPKYTNLPNLLSRYTFYRVVIIASTAIFPQIGRLSQLELWDSRRTVRPIMTLLASRLECRTSARRGTSVSRRTGSKRLALAPPGRYFALRMDTVRHGSHEW